MATPSPPTSRPKLKPSLVLPNIYSNQQQEQQATPTPTTSTCSASTPHHTPRPSSSRRPPLTIAPVVSSSTSSSSFNHYHHHFNTQQQPPSSASSPPRSPHLLHGHHHSRELSIGSSSSSSSSSRPSTTIIQSSSSRHHHHPSSSSLASSLASLSLSVSSPTSRPHSSSNAPPPISPSLSSIPTNGLGPSVYPTTQIPFDPDLEDGGRLNDPRKIILDIQTAMNGPAHHHLNPELLRPSNCSSNPSILNNGSAITRSARSSSTSSTSIKPIPIRRPKTSSSGAPSGHTTPQLINHQLNSSSSSSSPSPSPSLLIVPNQQHPDLHHNQQREGQLDSKTPTTTGVVRQTGGQTAQNGAEEEEESIEFEPSDLEILNTLGEGAGGEVKRVLHRPSGLYMAKKTIPTSPNPSVHRQILRELAFNREVADGQSPWITKYYGAYLEENDTQIAILMEYCEGGSFEALYKRIKSRQGRIGEKILARVAVSVLEGLSYLHTRRIIHRDIKPSNILITRDGQIKLCDLGVSGELIGSLAGTFMGTSAYMAPERIRGERYSITSDVWSLGLTLLELGLNRFPFSTINEDGSVSHLQPFELLQTIVTFEMPCLDDESLNIKFTKTFQNFLKTCLDKNPNSRPGPKLLLEQHPWIIKSQKWELDIVKWLIDVWGWRK